MPSEAAGSGGTSAAAGSGSISRAPANGDAKGNSAGNPNADRGAAAGGASDEPIAPATPAGAKGQDMGMSMTMTPSPPPNTSERAISGKVIDFYRQPVPNVQVTVGAATVTTGANGEFSANAGASYDATVAVLAVQSKTIWKYVGVTRADPTLQIESGGVIRWAGVDVTLNGVGSAREEGDTLQLSYAAPGGAYLPDPSSSSAYASSISWEGSVSTSMTVHALRYLKLPGRTEPTDFYAYDTQSLSVTEMGNALVNLDLPNTERIGASGSVYGNLVQPAGTQAQVQMWLRFPDHASFPLVSDDSITTVFGYFAPTIPEGTFTLLAVAGGGDGEVSLAHVSGVKVNDPHAMLVLPPVPRNLSPGDGATLSEGAPIQWSGDAGLFLLRVRSPDSGDTMQVVTSAREAQLPEAPGFDVPSGSSVYWWVETHGGWASVDDATTSEGFLDTCTRDHKPLGPARAAGTMAESAATALIVP